VHCCVAVGPDRVLVVDGNASKSCLKRVLLRPVGFEVSAIGVVLCVP
jgi:hypothetical protein